MIKTHQRELDVRQPVFKNDPILSLMPYDPDMMFLEFYFSG